MEKEIKVANGYVYLTLALLSVLLVLVGFIVTQGNPRFLMLVPFPVFIATGFFIVNPNSSKVLVLFGAYKGTVKDNGFFWANPFFPNKKFL